MPEVKSTVLIGERGAAYRLRPGKGEESPQRAYLSKDGRTEEMELVNDLLREGGAPLVVNREGQVQQNFFQRNKYGGTAPPGYGEHPDELKLWKTPVFRVHPISQRLEAINGLFFRLWPEHVKILQLMKWEGWPHVEIVAVAKELRKRQDEQFQRDEQMAQQHLAMAQAQEEQEAAEIHGFRPEEAGMLPEGAPPGAPPPEAGAPPGMPPPEAGPPPEEAGMPPAGAPPMMRGLSLSQGDDYLDKLEDFRGKFYSRDGFDSLRRSRRNQNSRERSNDQMKKNTSVREDNGRGFGVIIKNTFDFVDAETLGDRKREKDRSYTVRESGILNSPPSQEVETDREELEEEV